MGIPAVRLAKSIELVIRRAQDQILHLAELFLEVSSVLWQASAVCHFLIVPFFRFPVNCAAQYFGAALIIGRFRWC